MALTAFQPRVWLLCSQMRVFNALVGKKFDGNGLVDSPVPDDPGRGLFPADGPDRLWLTDISWRTTTWSPAVVATPFGRGVGWVELGRRATMRP